MTAKRLRLLHDLVPQAVHVAVLVNPTNAVTAETTLRELQHAAPTIGLQIQIIKASTIGEIDAAFATFCARASRRPLCRWRRIFHQPSRAVCHLDGARQDSDDVC